MASYLPSLSRYHLVPIFATLACLSACRGGDIGTPDGGSGDAPLTDQNTISCTDEQPVAGLAERCCPTFGIDACGPGLFCAAFDGRAFAACYAEHARLDGETCTADIQCLSYRCNTSVGRCSASPNTTCSVELGCGPGPSDNTFVCAGARCVSSTGANGRPCGLDSDCQSRFCVNEQCESGALGAACGDVDDCVSRFCFSGECVSGGEGSPCRNEDDCNDGYCIGGRCASGDNGSACSRDDQCTSEHCVDNTCASGQQGSECLGSDDCNTGLACAQNCNSTPCREGLCSSGAVGAPCVARTDCAAGLFCVNGGLFAQFDRCSAQEPQCWFDGDCEAGTRCADIAGGSYCRPNGLAADGATCTTDTDCASLICADYGPGGLRCSAVRSYGAHCEWFEREPMYPGGLRYTEPVGCGEGFRCPGPSTRGARSTCVAGRDTRCGVRYEGEWTSVIPCTDGIDGCTSRHYLHTTCENAPAQRCTTDAECPGSVCVQFYGCSR